VVRLSWNMSRYNNTTPREVSVKLQASMEGLIKRLTGCQVQYVESKLEWGDQKGECCHTNSRQVQANAWENLPVFIGAVLCALHAGVSKPVVEQACVNYLACRSLLLCLWKAALWTPGIYKRHAKRR
jgi:hypothetical protein